MADTFWYITLVCLPAPLVAVALVALTRRLTWRRSLLAALFAQWIVVVAVVAQARPGMSACSRSDATCLRSLVAPVSPHDVLDFRLQLLLWFGLGGTVSAIAVGMLAAWAVRRMWPASSERATPSRIGLTI